MYFVIKELHDIFYILLGCEVRLKKLRFKEELHIVTIIIIIIFIIFNKENFQGIVIYFVIKKSCMLFLLLSVACYSLHFIKLRG